MDFGYKFKSALFGFSKKDVIRCIEELHASHEETVEQLNQQLAETKQELADVNAKLTESNTAVVELNRRFEEQRQKNAALEKVVKRLVDSRSEAEKDMTLLKQRATAANNKSAEMILKNNELARKLKEAQEKVEKYDRLTQDISDVMLEARQISEKIREDANEEAAGIVEGAKQSVASIRADMDLFQRKICQVSHSLEQVTQNLRREVGRIEDSFTELNDRMDRLEIPQPVPAQEEAEIKDAKEAVQADVPVQPPAESRPVSREERKTAVKASARTAHRNSVTDLIEKFKGLM